jgi:isopentenyl diphosphate isomerase/L-lactate dehydrogenase-like FMN-dependent dehydrogenase
VKVASVTDYREVARRRLPRFLFEYVDGGSYGEVTLRGNVADLESIELRQRVLRNVSSIDVSTHLLAVGSRCPLRSRPSGSRDSMRVAAKCRLRVRHTHLACRSASGQFPRVRSMK